MNLKKKLKEMDKAITREELVSAARKLYKSGWWQSEQLDAVLEENFPELKESEDERIRKDIIALIEFGVSKGSVVTPFSRTTKEEALAYLEKQKAKERLDRMAPIYNDKESFESALEKAWKYYNESASRTVDSFEDDYIECVFSKGFREGFLYKEKQKERKPAERLSKEEVESAEPKRKFKIGDVVTNGQDIYTIHLMGSDRYWLKEHDCATIPFEYENDWNKVEPKFKVGDKVKLASEPKYPAREIVEIKDSAYYFDSAVHLPFAKQDEWELVEQKKQIKWPHVEPISEEENLCLMPQEQKPVEWSEEDEKMIERLTRILELGSKGFHADYTKEGYAEAYSWLKSLPLNLKKKNEDVAKLCSNEWSEEDENAIRFKINKQTR